VKLSLRILYGGEAHFGLCSPASARFEIFGVEECSIQFVDLYAWHSGITLLLKAIRNKLIPVSLSSFDFAQLRELLTLTSFLQFPSSACKLQLNHESEHGVSCEAITLNWPNLMSSDLRVTDVMDRPPSRRVGYVVVMMVGSRIASSVLLPHLSLARKQPALSDIKTTPVGKIRSTDSRSSTIFSCSLNH
jgi:hypothetical protein